MNSVLAAVNARLETAVFPKLTTAELIKSLGKLGIKAQYETGIIGLPAVLLIRPKSAAALCKAVIGQGLLAKYRCFMLKDIPNTIFGFSGISENAIFLETLPQVAVIPANIAKLKAADAPQKIKAYIDKGLAR